MRTKTLLLSAALGVVGIAAASAQVYSVNVVGYTTVTLPAGFSLIANQLSSTNNTIPALFPNPQLGSIIYKYTGGSFVANNYFFTWTDPSMTLSPGEGAFFYNPGTNQTATFVGEVVQGPTTNAMPAGFSIRSVVTPQAGTLDSFGYPVADGDIVYRYSGGSFVAYNYFFGWAPSVPAVSVGESFFAFKGSAASWTRTFTVQ